MEPQTVIDLMQKLFKISLVLSAPCLMFALSIGVIISIFQSITSIQEQTLVFVPKMLAAITALIIFFPWMLNSFIEYTIILFNSIPAFIK